MKFSIIIPAHNEAGNLAILIPRLNDAVRRLDYEIIIVDNKSQDNTQEVLLKLKKIVPNLIIVKEPILGYGRAVLTGLQNSRGDILGIIRADNQEKPSDLVGLYNYLKEKNLDLAKAVRKSRMSEGVKRIIISKIYNTLFRIIFGLKLKDINATPKIITRKFYEHAALESKDWFIDAEIVIKAANLGYKIGEMEIEYLPRLKGKSNVKLGHIYQFLKNMMVWSKRLRNGKLLAK